MRILFVHSRYQVRGGEEACLEAEVELLRQHGHTVEVYEEHNDRAKSLTMLQLATRTVWSQESYQAIRARLSTEPFDIVHVHNFFQMISPAVYHAAHMAGVPIVQTLHNYRLMCPSGVFMRDGKICEDCLGQPVPWPGIVHSCYRDSRAASSVVAAMLSTHRALRTWNLISRYIALTTFARDKFIQGGFPAEKLVIKPNFLNQDPEIGTGAGRYALYAGRLSPEKGIRLMLSAWEQLGDRIPLKIIGDGPLVSDVEAAAAKNPAIAWLGRQPSDKVYALLKDATFLMFPSEWYEGLPRIVIESFAVGTPVVAANLGSMSSLVTPDRTGLHFRAGDVSDLVTTVHHLLSNPTALAEMRQTARIEYETHYTAAKNYDQLIEIYNGACKSHRIAQSTATSTGS